MTSRRSATAATSSSTRIGRDRSVPPPRASRGDLRRYRHFKRINDAYGHDCGEAILLASARRLEESIRPQDTVARLAGDGVRRTARKPPRRGSGHRGARANRRRPAASRSGRHAIPRRLSQRRRPRRPARRREHRSLCSARPIATCTRSSAPLARADAISADAERQRRRQGDSGVGTSHSERSRRGRADASNAGIRRTVDSISGVACPSPSGGRSGSSCLEG
jgi:hypothetical protein